jgi:hypothetical protein
MFSQSVALTSSIRSRELTQTLLARLTASAVLLPYGAISSMTPAKVHSR